MVVALTHANGDVNDPVVRTQYQEICDTIEYEQKEAPEPLSVSQMFKTPAARKRIIICISVAVFSTVAGLLRFPREPNLNLMHSSTLQEM
jgi:hypothetical protein